MEANIFSNFLIKYKASASDYQKHVLYSFLINLIEKLNNPKMNRRKRQMKHNGWYEEKTGITPDTTTKVGSKKERMQN